MSLIKGSSRGRPAEIQVSALLLTQAPACHLLASVEKPGSFPSLLLLLLLLPVCWILGPACLSELGLTPSCPLSSTESSDVCCSSLLPREKRACKREGNGCCPASWLQLSFERKGLPTLALQVLGLSCLGLLLSSLPTLAEKTQGLVFPIPPPPPGWISQARLASAAVAPPQNET